jgi:hypothetical protein
LAAWRSSSGKDEAWQEVEGSVEQFLVASQLADVDHCWSGFWKASMSQTQPQGVEVVEQQEEQGHIVFGRLAAGADSVVLEYAGDPVRVTNILPRFLIQQILVGGVVLFAVESLAKRLSYQDKLLGKRLVATPDSPAEGKGAAGPGSVLVYGTTSRGNEDTACSTVVNHGQIETRESLAGILLDDKVSLKQLLRGQARSSPQAQHVIGAKGQFEHAAAFGKTGQLLVT